MKKLFAVLATILLFAIMACSSGEGGGNNTEPTAPTTLTTYNITGQIKANAGLTGVTVSLTRRGTSTVSTTTDSSGNYSFTGQTNGNYTVTPSLTGYTFSPSSTAVTVSGANKTNINFTAADNTVTSSMSGTIHIGSNSGAVLSDVTVSIAGLTATTTSSGTFIITGIPAGTYAFSVSKSGYYTYADSAYYVGSDQTGLNFYLAQSGTSGDYTSPNVGTLKYVPPGTFQRDSTSTNISMVSAFRMSQYEITRAQFLAVMSTDPTDTSYSSGTNDPVFRVNWYHAIAFCNKLSIAEGLTPVYSVSDVNFPTLSYAEIPTSDSTDWNAATANWSVNGYRLPTEMEWIWAAMGATSGSGYTSGISTTGYAKAFAGSTGSNAIGDYVWYYDNSSSMTHPIGTKLPNELGLYDMSGNVYEWCWDWWESYPTGTLTDYRGPASGAQRVVRSSMWTSNAFLASIAYRGITGESCSQFDGGGFRVVRP